MVFDVIVADCPWLYDIDRGNQRASCENHYPTLDVAAMKALPVAELAAKDCSLFFWATFPMLPQALEVINAWGFDYKSVGFTWVKTNIKAGTPFVGLGWVTRGNAEPCLRATRGKPAKPKGKAVSSLVQAPRGKHSAKPEAIQDRIEELFPNARKLELFARRERAGWTCVGNEITGRDIREDIYLLSNG